MNSINAPAVFEVVPFIFVVIFERPREEGIVASARRDRSNAVQKFIREARRSSSNGSAALADGSSLFHWSSFVVSDCFVS
jgi:hypothetical protein